MIRTILCPIDFSPVLERELEPAAAEEILLEESLLEAQLAIMGAHPKGFVERLITRGASTAREVLHRSSCPVWFVPAG